MELLQLRYFMAVARHEHVTKAAEELLVAQPSISQAISRLEKELEVKLFDRVGKTIQINEYGKVLYRRAEQIFAQIDELHREFEAVRNASQNSIRVKLWPGSNLLPAILTSFSEKYPYISLQVVPEQSGEPYDFRFSMASYDAPPHPCDVLLQEEILLAVPRSHALAKYASVPLSAVREEPFIMFPHSKPFRHLAESYCRLAGFEPDIVYENESYQAANELIRLGQGVALVPNKSWGDVTTPYTRLLKLDSPICMRTFYLSWQEEKVFNEADRIFREFVHAYYNECFGNTILQQPLE